MSSAGSVSSDEMRIVASTPTCSSSSRLSANASVRADAASSHCTSSTATRTGPSAATMRSAPRNAAATARSSGATPSASSTSKDTARARRCGAGSRTRTSSRSSRKRSARPANARRTSALPGRVASTRTPCDCARSRPSRHRRVFPIPAAPSKKSARGHWSELARKSSRAASSLCLAMMLPTMPASCQEA